MVENIKLLKKIGSPEDLKKLNLSELTLLAREIRSVLIKTIAKNGGHLASNLGVVELTIALHYVYDSPKDKLIFDVGHQAYTHKLLTGRQAQFSTIRQSGGLSGYLKREESEHDIFGAGHVGTAVSAALGFAEGQDRKSEKSESIAIVGDGALTNGLTYEGINNTGGLGSNVTLVLNDNKYSISKITGGIGKYLEKLSSIRLEDAPQTDLESIFHALGFTYFGPVDGHDISKLIDIFKVAKETKGPKLIHVLTKKGHGYSYSESAPDKFHSTNPFIWESGKVEKDTTNLTYTQIFSDALIKIAEKDKKVIGITAAMPAGTGLEAFAQKFPDRFYDVGIAESHAVVFAGALALQGLKPVVAIYSTFLQRSYDQIIHDICLQNIPVIFAVDRAGIVGSDGPTHHGLFDLSYLRSIPHLTVLAPKDERELQDMLFSALKKNNAPVAIRYPRGSGIGISLGSKPQIIDYYQSEKIYAGKDAAIIAIGSMVYPSIEAAKKLSEQGLEVTVYNARSVKPIDQKMILDAAETGKILTVEENILDGGFGSAVLEELEKNGLHNVKVKRLGISSFIEHGGISELREKYGLDTNNILEKLKALLKE